MSISNPLTILFWLGIYGSVLAKTAATYETSQLILYSSAIFIGLLIWDFTMAGISSNFRKYLTSKLLIGISLFIRNVIDWFRNILWLSSLYCIIWIINSQRKNHWQICVLSGWPRTKYFSFFLFLFPL